MAKYLDYEGLKEYNNQLKNYISGITGNDYKVADNAVNIKQYIDSRIFVGTAAEVELALERKLIDDTTFAMVCDEDTTEMTRIDDSEISNLFK